MIPIHLATIVADPDRIGDVPRAELPGLLGALEVVRARVWARLSEPVGTSPGATPVAEGGDELLTVKQAAHALNVDERWMYRHAPSLPFTRRLGNRTLRFSERGLRRWMESRR
jgi:predicted DNA-binding transcriptional regulator AlpA